MHINLTEIEARVLGSLIEKSITTPDYYPLTLNSLTTACNQKSNREPVLDLDERDVVRALDSLRDCQLIYQLTSAGSRVPKYAHCLERVVIFAVEELAVLAVLMLRGFQTAGELRSRTQRLHEFASVEAVEATLAELAERADGPFVVQLPRQPGRREPRYAHLLGGPVELDAEEPPELMEAATRAVRADEQRLGQLEAQVAQLQEQMAQLQAQFEAFRAEFK